MLSGHNVRSILLRFLVWKVDSLLRSLSVILHHSEPYRRVGSMQLWYNLSLVLVLYWDDFHTALLRRFLVSLPPPRSRLTVLPRRKNSSVVVRSPSVHFDRRGIWDIQQHHVCLLLADLQDYLMCKHAETGSHRRHPELQGFRRVSIWGPVVGRMLFAASPSQSSSWRETPT